MTKTIALANQNSDRGFSIEIISAGAGSGKTYTLTERLISLLREGLSPQNLIATTFTQKAAAELRERVRTGLLKAGMSKEANEIGDALIGTVHSIGVKLLQRFAFEAGVSPLVEIIAEEDGQRLFNESLSQVLTEDRVVEMNELCERLGLNKKRMGEAYDWRKLIREVTDIARINNFSEQVIRESKAYSISSFLKLLPEKHSTDLIQWQNQLLAEIDQCIEALENNEADETKTTRDSVEALKQAVHKFKWKGRLDWFELVRLSKLKIAAKSKELFVPLKEKLDSHAALPEFHADNQRLIELVFDISSEALKEYERYKRSRGLIDYSDMETGVRKILRIPSVQNTLMAELDLLMVDEFQDTSPLQLDLFIQLSKLASRSIWVGDPKQSIYGFRGAEPALMEAVVEASGGVKDENILKKSWRSRPELVQAVNAVFTKAFKYIPEERIVLEPAHAETPEGKNHPALIHWLFKNEEDERRPPGQPWLDNCIALQIRALIDQKTPVWDKKRTASRSIQPGDIAILCRSNDECQRMSEALHRAGLRAAMSRKGLLATAEIRLITACLKYLLTPSDTLSLAEIAILSGEFTLETFTNEFILDPEKTAQEVRLGQAILERRNALVEQSPSELLHQFISQLEIRKTVAALGSATQRLDNVDRLHKLALEYESACQRLHIAASISGFVLWLNRLEETGSDYQGSGEDEQTVRVMTYHKSKGLEFPVTICHRLDSRLREKIWGPQLVSTTEKPDLNDILSNRLIRLWTNPYSDQIAKTALEEAVKATSAWEEAKTQALEEEARLLYVGFTRARDYLILPSTKKGTPWLNRVIFDGDDSIPALDPDMPESPFEYKGTAVPIQHNTIYREKETETFPTPQEVFKTEKNEAAPPLDYQPKYPDPGEPLKLQVQVQSVPVFGAQSETEDPSLIQILMAVLPVLKPGMPKESVEEVLNFHAGRLSIENRATLAGGLQQANEYSAWLAGLGAGMAWYINAPVPLTVGDKTYRLSAHQIGISKSAVVATLISKKAESADMHHAERLLLSLQAHFPEKHQSVYLISLSEGTAKLLNL